MNRRSFLVESASLATLLPGARRSVLLSGLKANRILLEQGTREFVVPPGSTLKPLVLLALLQSRKLLPQEEYACPGRLQIGARQLNCSHPHLAVPMNAARAISYSCNCAVAHFSARFDRDELANFLRAQGLNSQTGVYGPGLPLQALGEDGVRVTPLELLRAYRNLALKTAERDFEPILSGLEGAVEFGTAQNARLPKVRVAGKTGTVRSSAGNYFGWFAGFAPSREPEVVVTVLVPGHSGGADAAPVAARALQDYFAGKH